MVKRPLTSAVEDYLKTIYELGAREVKTQALADALEVSPASVTCMLQKLASLKLVAYEKYKGVSLSPAGQRIALETLRHHRLIETYLAQALGYAWHEVHDEAERLEHHISEDFEDRIAELLGDPTYDPHGDPIPRRDGSLPEDLGQPLAEIALGQTVTITRITNQQREVLRYLAEHKLVLGETVTLRARAPFGGPLTLEQDGSRIAIAHELAHAIHVAPMADATVDSRRASL
ncbi:metal-dependent transcriptional regulator [soil metagenome]